jgi:hypothetical protein
LVDKFQPSEVKAMEGIRDRDRDTASPEPSPHMDLFSQSAQQHAATSLIPIQVDPHAIKAMA